ncbi:F-box/FBD/LRR-repeat protein At3g14710-like [Vicia villosa]|uniref:F-box/FBD/LRR-repeat protein At3g14710-like n=1 Tax=Vicia villosa TaxID=3911 RepID=UPI00273BF126|nr:F-box/FBD/LRR-repeat protein At3g14710-like [Vicia villosa]
MASTSSVRPKKNDKAKEDIISKLPDSLITRILSLLPTKAAVRTSVLSKRWIESWTLITKITFNDSVFYIRKRKKSRGKQNFINFVYRTLAKVYNVEKFSVFLTNKYDATIVNTWISCILSRRVKKLRIWTDFKLPFSPLTCHSLFNHSYNLEELELDMDSCAIKVPSPPSYGFFIFRNLKVLRLHGVIFTMDKSLHMVLESLKKFEIENCSWLSAYDVTLEAPRLESVVIVQGLEAVTREPRSCTIKFSVSCMKEFTYEGVGGISQPIVLSNPSAASDTFVKIMLHRDGSYVQETGSRACLLLKQFSQAKRIEFHGSEVLTQPNMIALPRFAMLSHLDLGIITGDVLLSLLQKSPILNTLVLKEISKFDQELLKSAAVPECLASSLQVVKFESVRGSEHELFLAKYFMENGIVLERMSFAVNLWLSKSKAIEEFKEKLNKEIMVAPSVVSKEVEDIESSYTVEEKIPSFRTELVISSSKDKHMVILEACSPWDRLPWPYLIIPFLYIYFYFHPSRTWGYFPFSPFKVEVLRVHNIVSSQLVLIVRALLGHSK